MSLAEWLDTSPPHERPVAERLVELVDRLPEAWVEPVQVGLFIKRGSSFAQLRTMTQWTALSLKLTREVTRPEPSRKVSRQGSRYHHVYNLHHPNDLTPDLVELLTEAYEADSR